jgi:hypothetical protein
MVFWSKYVNLHWILLPQAVSGSVIQSMDEWMSERESERVSEWVSQAIIQTAVILSTYLHVPLPLYFRNIYYKTTTLLLR